MLMGKLIQESGERAIVAVLYINTIWGHVSMELNCVQTMRKSKVYVHATTLRRRSQNAEQLRENGRLRCSRKPATALIVATAALAGHDATKGSVETATVTAATTGDT